MRMTVYYIKPVEQTEVHEVGDKPSSQIHGVYLVEYKKKKKKSCILVSPPKTTVANSVQTTGFVA